MPKKAKILGTDDIHEIKSKAVAIGDVWDMGKGVHVGQTPIEISTFLCPKCDGTHLQLTLPGMDAAFSFVLEAKEAQQFADYLLNPSVLRHKH